MKQSVQRGVFASSGTGIDADTWSLCLTVSFSPCSGSGLPQTRVRNEGDLIVINLPEQAKTHSTKSLVHRAVFALQPEYLHRFDIYMLIKAMDLFHEADLESASAPVEVCRDFSVDLGAVSEEMNVMQKRVLGFTGEKPWNYHCPFWCNVKPLAIISVNCKHCWRNPR